MSRIRPLAPAIVIVAVTVAATFGLIAGPSKVKPSPTASYVVIAGAAGLRWDDVNPQDTPTLWKLAGRGAIGALSVRSGHNPTCPDDGWLTLGAGNYARRSPSLDTECPPSAVRIATPDQIGAFLPDQRTIVRENREASLGTQPGALPEAVRCTVAVGPGAAVAAARPYGRVDKYVRSLPADAGALRCSCVLSMVDLGTIVGADAASRRGAVRAADRTLAHVLEARPENSLVLVAGLSDTDLISRLHVAIADGPGFRGGWITSSTTGRPGYLQLIDLAPTTLAVLRKPPPAKLFAGQPADRTGGRPADLDAAVARLADADREAGAQQRVTGRFFGILAVCHLVLMALMVLVIRRTRAATSAGDPQSRPPPRWLPRVVDVGLVAAALSIPAALLTDAVPWWRSAHAGPLFTVVLLAVLGAGTAAVVSTPVRGHALGIVGVVCALSVTVVGVDLMTGARLQLNGVAGYSALEGGRYAGVGTVALGVFLAGVLLGAGVLAQQFPRPWRPACVAVVAGVGVVLVGNPYLGADAGGAVALTAGGCLTAALSTGGWLTFARVAWATLAGVAVTVGFALLDVRQAPQDRGSLGVLLTQSGSGGGLPAPYRTGSANVGALLTSPLSLLVLGSMVFTIFVLLRPWGGLKRLFGISPAVKAGLVGVVVAGVFAGVVDFAGFNVVGAAAATVVPMAAFASLQVLRRMDLRTPAPPGWPGTPGAPGAGAGPPGAAEQPRLPRPPAEPGGVEVPAPAAEPGGVEVPAPARSGEPVGAAPGPLASRTGPDAVASRTGPDAVASRTGPDGAGASTVAGSSGSGEPRRLAGEPGGRDSGGEVDLPAR